MALVSCTSPVPRCAVHPTSPFRFRFDKWLFMPLFDYSFIYVYFFYIKIQLIADQVLRMAHLLKVATHIKLKLFVTVSFDLENRNNEINFLY